MKKAVPAFLGAESIPENNRPAWRLALITSLLVTVLGAVYFVYMVCLAVGGKMTFPPSQDVQLFGGVTTALAALLLTVMFVSVHSLAPDRVKVYSLTAVVFCALFSAFVGINRFVQLSVVRLSLLEGKTEGLSRFLPYDGRSAMFALEMIGWGLMLGIAVFFLALSLERKGPSGVARFLFFLYTVLGLVCAVAFILDSPLSVIGFVAWGLILYLATGALALSIWRSNRKGNVQ